MRRTFYTGLSLCLAWMVCCTARAGEASDEKPTGLRIQPASDEGEAAIAKMQVPSGLKVELFAAEPMLANPVCIRSDEKGRVYVVETFRRSWGVVDIRGHLDWADEDIASRTVADRIALLKRKFGPNIRRLKEESESIAVLEDTTGTGKADKSTTFADGFNSIEDGAAASILPYHRSVYFTDIPSVYLLGDSTGSGKADVRKVLSTGYGVHIAYRGHDLHGLRIGPDGKLYFSMADRGLSVKTDRGTIDLPDTGSVLRCDLDGSNLEVFATGLRNPEQLVFDQYGNLFTGDNNPDFGDPARWVYVIEGGDSGWRSYYQLNRKPIIGGPWMTEHLWEVQPRLNAAYIVPPVAHLGAGPSGVAYYPGTGMSDRWNEHLFMVDFRGAPTGSGIHTFKMKPNGAGFDLIDREAFIWNILATDIDFSVMGGAYVSDWVQGWATTGKGRIYRVFDPQGAKAPLVAETRKLLSQGMDGRKPEELLRLLSHPDIRIRQEAQFALAAAGPPSIPGLVHAASGGELLVERLAGIWGLGQIGRIAPEALNPLIPLLKDKDAEVRAQAAKVLGEDRDAGAFDELVKRLADPNTRVRFFAALALGRLGRQEAVAPLLAMLRENADQDGWLRHAGVMGLVGSVDASALLAAADDPSPAARMGVLLSLRRLGRPEIARFLLDRDERFVLEAARAIYDTPIEAAMPALAALATRTGLSEPVMARVIGANFRLGTLSAAEALAKVAARQNVPAPWRVEALHDLGAWENPPSLDPFLHAYRPLASRDPKIARDAISPVLTTILQSAPDAVRVAAVALIETLNIENGDVLYDLAVGGQFPVKVRQQALDVMARHNHPKLEAAVNFALQATDEPLRCTAIRCLAKLPESVEKLRLFAESGSIAQRQAAFAALAEAPGGSVNEILSTWMDRLLAAQVPPELHLDLLDAAGKRSDAALEAKIKQYASAHSSDDALAPWRDALVGGDAESGHRVFRERLDASCVGCHIAAGDGGIVGPKLDGIGSRQPREYLLESIVFPNAKIAPGYESTTVKRMDGSTINGILKKETQAELVLLKSDGKTARISKTDIKSRERGLSAMPEGLANVLSKRDLRDLVEFLATLR